MYNDEKGDDDKNDKSYLSIYLSFFHSKSW